MNRRSFFKSVLAGTCGFLGVGAAREAQEIDTAPFPIDDYLAPHGAYMYTAQAIVKQMCEQPVGRLKTRTSRLLIVGTDADKTLEALDWLERCVPLDGYICKPDFLNKSMLLMRHPSDDGTNIVCEIVLVDESNEYDLQRMLNTECTSAWLCGEGHDKRIYQSAFMRCKRYPRGCKSGSVYHHEVF